MKFFRSIIIMILIVVIILPFNIGSAASGIWEAGVEWTEGEYGVEAYISSPLSLPDPMVGLGVSNWVSTYEPIPGGGRWIQAGWELIPERGVFIPRQYVEVCHAYDANTKQCDNIGQHWYQTGLNQDWGTSYVYEVYRVPYTDQWCGATGDPEIPNGVVQRYCFNGLHENNAVDISVRSETKDDTNAIYTIFDSMTYKPFANQNTWYYQANNPQSRIEEPPYIFGFLINYTKMITMRGSHVFLPYIVR